MQDKLSRVGMTLILTMLLTSGLSGCGQKGDLYPAEDKQAAVTAQPART